MYKKVNHIGLNKIITMKSKYGEIYSSYELNNSIVIHNKCIANIMKVYNYYIYHVIYSIITIRYLMICNLIGKEVEMQWEEI